MTHYVYFLYDVDETVLLYIGRSLVPQDRCRDFIRREGLSAVVGQMIACPSFEEACSIELSEIIKHHPPFNKWLASNKGYLGRHHSEESIAKILRVRGNFKHTPESKQWMSLTHRGRRKTPEHRAALSQSLKGRPGHPCSAEAREKIRLSKLGKPRSLETRMKLSATMRAKAAAARSAAEV